MIHRTDSPRANAGRWRRTLVCACLVAFSQIANAQVIPVKSARIAEGDQFGFLPALNAGLAGVSIAVVDTLSDPFTNPAKAARLRGGMWFSSPSVYAVSSDAGGARTFPVGALARQRTGGFFGGFAAAIQEVSTPGPDDLNGGPIPLDVQVGFGGPFPQGVPQQDSRTNRYAFGLLGHSFQRFGISVAASGMWSALNALDGVDLMYQGSQRLRQRGSAADLRVGVLKDWGGRRSRALEAVFLHGRYAMTHDVDFLEFFWDPARRLPISRTWSEHHEDQTRMWGAHFGYQQRLSDSTWRVGAVVTGNRTWHPQMENYTLMNIGRNPGNSSAFNAGLGISKTLGSATVALDAIYEPIWAHAWESARVNDNRFRFDNGVVRGGVSRVFRLDTPGTSVSMQLGTQLRRVLYELDQRDSTGVMSRSHAGWDEWTYSWGTKIHLSRIDIVYQARLQSGIGRPAVPSRQVFFDVLATADVAAAPISGNVAPSSGAPSLVPVRVATQQFSISIPIGRVP